MRTSSAAAIRRGIAVSSAVTLLLVGASPAYSDSVRSDQWYLDAMQAEQMWKSSTGENVTVAVIDSGVDASIPDLRGRVLKGKDLAAASPGDEHTDYDNHGTGMASIIAGTGNVRGGGGSFGLAPGVKILPIRLRDTTGKVNGATGNKYLNEDLSVAIRFAVDHGAKIINASVGDSIGGSQQLTDSVKYALDKGALIFAAVGNSADEGNLIEYPAGTPGVVGVGAIGKDLHKADFSQWGPQVDLSAPGVDMVHGCSGGTKLCRTSGTSDAAAIVSASAALIWSKHLDWTNNQVLRVLLNTVGAPTSGALRNDYVGYGVVRPRIALKNPGDPGPADEYPLPDLAAAESPSPSAKPSKAGGSSEDIDKPAATALASDGLWIGVGVGVAALAGAAVAFAAVRSRRRKAAASAPPPYAHQQPHSPYPYQQPQSQSQTPQPPYPPHSPPPGAQDPRSPYTSPPSRGGGPTR
ncbi:type VII secretion-associated serine protease mycosin [Streptomyces atratus]|uniref:Type VII secretion-associated serine protease mycosin n=1 Tax=Streptomyces atratus TaxID=1893 RepID=A0A2Z5JD01_STRAR|nr:type VII secretion-associated serine protease mycosin [Streptomyces atratus]AXE78199.1 type VII secretion-associated serine protease mycosin [Streptomyces atratus]